MIMSATSLGSGLVDPRAVHGGEVSRDWTGCPVLAISLMGPAPRMTVDMLRRRPASGENQAQAWCLKGQRRPGRVNVYNKTLSSDSARSEYSGTAVFRRLRRTRRAKKKKSQQKGKNQINAPHQGSGPWRHCGCQARDLYIKRHCEKQTYPQHATTRGLVH